jgi:hypothetical protein
MILKTSNGDYVSHDDFTKALDKFRSFLDESKTYYLEEEGFFERVSLGGQMYGTVGFLIFFACPEALYREEMLVDRFRILFTFQSSLNRNPKAEDGYIIADLKNLTAYYTRKEALNTIYCAYIADEDKFIYKPLSLMLAYFRAIKKRIPTIEEDRGYKKFPIRVNPKANPDLGKSWNGIMRIGSAQVAQMKSGNMIITESDMKKFLLEHNCYPDSWRLNFKVATNLLKELI